MIQLADGKARTIQRMMATTFWSPDGKPMSAAEFIERLFGDLPEFFKNKDEFRAIWSRPDTRKALMGALQEKGYSQDTLTDVRQMIDAEKSDVFDLLAYIAFALDPTTRQERVEGRRQRILAHYDEKLQAFIDFVLAQYVKGEVGELEQENQPRFLKLKYGSTSDGVAELGGITDIRDMFIGFQQYLYSRNGELEV